MTNTEPKPPVSLQDQAWFAAVLVLYALVELSFNHRMLELTDVVLSDKDLDGVQFLQECSHGFGRQKRDLELLNHPALDPINAHADWVPARAKAPVAATELFLVVNNVRPATVDAANQAG